MIRLNYRLPLYQAMFGVPNHCEEIKQIMLCSIINVGDDVNPSFFISSWEYTAHDCIASAMVQYFTMLLLLSLTLCRTGASAHLTSR